MQSRAFFRDVALPLAALELRDQAIDVVVGLLGSGDVIEIKAECYRVGHPPYFSVRIEINSEKWPHFNFIPGLV